MRSGHFLSVLVFCSLPLAGCGGGSAPLPDEAGGGTAGTAGTATGGSSGAGVAGTSGSGASGGTAGTAQGGSGGTGIAGASGSGGTTWPDRAAEPTDCAPGGPGATLPSEPFTCTVQNLLAMVAGASDVFWDWDASTLTLTEHGPRGDGTMWALYWTYTPDGRVTRYGEPGGFYYDYEYDEHGVVVRTTGNNYPEYVTGVEYDEAGRLVREEQMLPGVATPYARGYGYDEQDRLASVELDVGLDGVIESRATNTYHRGCSLDVVEQKGSYHGWADGTVIIRNAHFYDENDRLVRRESDGGGFFDTPADGVVDEFDRWTYALDGAVATFERDGTADDVGGPADGTPDESYAFSPECMKLVGFHRGVFRFPN